MIHFFSIMYEKKKKFFYLKKILIQPVNIENTTADLDKRKKSTLVIGE